MLWSSGAPFLSYTVTVDAADISLHRTGRASSDEVRVFRGGYGSLGRRNDILPHDIPPVHSRFVVRTAENVARNLDPRISEASLARIVDPADLASGIGCTPLSKPLASSRNSAGAGLLQDVAASCRSSRYLEESLLQCLTAVFNSIDQQTPIRAFTLKSWWVDIWFAPRVFVLELCSC